MFDFSNYSAKSKYYDDSSTSVLGKKENETSNVAIEELAIVGLKQKIHLILVRDSREYRKKKMQIKIF